MDRELYIEFLESEIRRIRAGANTHYGQSIGWMDEMQDLKLENDRLQQREKLYKDFINFCDCKDRPCTQCNQYRPDDVVVCKMTLPSSRHELINELKKRLEDIR